MHLIQWPPSIADVLAAGLFIGATIAQGFQGYFARQRLFAKVNKLGRKTNELYEIAIAKGDIRPTMAGRRDDDED